MEFCQLNALILAASHDLLCCGDDLSVMRKAVYRLHDLFLNLTEVGLSDCREDIFLTSGKAISPVEAVHCLLEMKRTAIFLRGVNQAINELIVQKEDSPVRILYAGTGPYASLVSPLLHLYLPQTVQVDLLEINTFSMQIAIILMEKLGLRDYVGDVYSGVDASAFKVTKSYDLVISETMQAVLKKEPQVAIMQNLIPQLPKHAVFIPQQITVDAALLSRGKWNAEKMIIESIEQIDLGRIMTVNKEHLHPDDFRSSLQLPQVPGNCVQLKLFTNIQVYGDHCLGESDSSLNMPFLLIESGDMAGEQLNFEYIQGELPHIRCTRVSTGDIFNAYGKPYRQVSNHNRNIGTIDKNR